MSGGSTSDTTKKGSGNVIDLKEKKKTAPPEVNERRPPVRPVEQRLEALEKRYDRDHKRWLHEMNSMSDSLREIRARAKTSIEALRAAAEKKQDEIDTYTAKFNKYLELNMELEDEIDTLKARIIELEGA